jgi:hypothetical protein
MAKVADKLVGAGNFVGKNYKPILYLALAGAAAFVLYRVVKKVTTSPSLGPDGGKLNENCAKISDQQAQIYATQLYDSMKGLGTDEKVIESIFKKLTPCDFVKVYNKFGTQKYSGTLLTGGGEPTWLGLQIGDYNDYDLIEWLREELSETTDRNAWAAIKAVVEPAGFTW